MKLEEALFAMRAGRVAIGSDGFKYRIVNGKAEMWSVASRAFLATNYFDANDGWTLEPEPKVEWPKGSLRWAMDQLKTGDIFANRLRRKSTGRFCDGANWPLINVDEATALDWEVVP